MKRLEKNRNRLFQKRLRERHGIIFPLILRGEKRLPDDIKNRWNYLVVDEIEDFDPHSIWKKYRLDIKKIGDKIEHLLSCYEVIQDELIEDCIQEYLPEKNDKEVEKILLQANPSHRFPGRRCS